MDSPTKNPPSSKPSHQNAHSANSVYTPLIQQRKEIRLLIIQPSLPALTGFPLGLISEPVCTLQTVSLLENPEYDCISYCWGDSNELCDIIVNGVTMQATINLNDALRQFRCDAQEAGQAPVRLWADAICINQKDVEEKNSQVAMMREIYSQAACVRIWLGPASAWNEDIAYGFNLVDRVGTQGRSAPEQIERFLMKPILGLGTLFANPYWRRRWITQEIAVARKLTIHFGPVNHAIMVEEEIVNLKYFCTQIVERYVEMSARGGGALPVTTPEEPTYLEWVAMFDKTKVVHAVLNQISAARSLVKRGKANELLQMLRGAEASVRHDHVYALLGMVSAESTLLPDYTKPWEEAFTAFTSTAMQVMRNLSMLYYASSGVSALPTWTLDWSAEVRADNNPVGVQDDYYADAGTSFSLVLVAPRAMRVRGLLIDTVQALGTTTSADLSRMPTMEELLHALTDHDTNHVFKDWIALYERHHRTDRRSTQKTGEVDEAMLRTLVADYVTRPSVDLAGQMAAIPRRMTATEVRRSTIELNRSLRGQSSNRDVYQEILDRMRKYSFFMTSDGRPGMAKQSVREGDKICIFSSCKVPYCIRPVRKNGEVVYSVISSCYINGIMDGEAILNAYAIAETILEAEVREHNIFEDVTLI